MYLVSKVYNYRTTILETLYYLILIKMWHIYREGSFIASHRIPRESHIYQEKMTDTDSREVIYHARHRPSHVCQHKLLTCERTVEKLCSENKKKTFRDRPYAVFVYKHRQKFKITYLLSGMNSGKNQ